MERELAERMLVALQSLNPGLDEAARIVQSMRNQEEAGLLRRHLGAVMADPLYEIVMHIVREYPDLDPDKTIDPGRKNDASVLHPLTESPPVVTDGCHRRLLRSRARVSAALLGSSSRGALGEHVDAFTHCVAAHFPPPHRSRPPARLLAASADGRFSCAGSLPHVTPGH